MEGNLTIKDVLQNIKNIFWSDGNVTCENVKKAIEQFKNLPNGYKRMLKEVTEGIEVKAKELINRRKTKNKADCNNSNEIKNPEEKDKKIENNTQDLTRE